MVAIRHERGGLQTFSSILLRDSCKIKPVERERCNSNAGPKTFGAKVRCDGVDTMLMSRRFGREEPDLTMLGNYSILGRRRGLPVGGSVRVFSLSADVLSQSCCSSLFDPVSHWTPCCQLRRPATQFLNMRRTCTWAVGVLCTLLALASGVCAQETEDDTGRKTCVIKASGTNTTDDAPAILEAFTQCGRRGKVVFEPTTYYVNSALNVTWLDDVEIDLQGTLLWSTNISYWLANSLDVGYQNQSTAFILGGNNVRLNGDGQGTFDGNGDYWYEWIRQQANTSNYPGRPHALTLNGLRNSVVKGVNFLRSQMWTLSIIYSHNVVLDSILVNNTGNRFQSSNTDGADTIRSSGIKFNNWTVYSGDDSISLKANSTDVSITNSKFYNGLGIALGSIGQYNDQFETIERLKVENCFFDNTLHAVYFKTWTDDQNGYPPNGGGGGLGFASDMSFKNLTVQGMRGAAFAISQCTRFRGAPGVGNCTNSQFQIRDITVDSMAGTTKSSRVASLQCSAVAPCTNIGLFDVDLEFANGTAATSYLCGNAVNPQGFNCTGTPCVGGSATGEC
ncbi:exo-rhamnogalacturonase B [Colletotrichum scovillei]|uniref:Exo-rhamnogalacturonase B n=2 Tax=Colletotrichum scovillei TaxID=1209932 RepID=A0A9P7QVU4_9PEZI|nr:exo-rhamnogalacturonase B [Colletotrichum scovillei]KAG7049114.1 exo-rhamnogalacturonase B [Colletotrichum scovillei]KAG7063855.1 exo-rhamnogalacturonase B [Colletotrichum scovillei]